MKKILFVVLAVAVAVSCGQVFDEYYPRVQNTWPADPVEEEEEPEPDPGEQTVDPSSYWYQAADSASMELLNRYWGPLLSRVTPDADVIANWHFTAQQDNKADPNNNYWHQPHALDAILDAYNRTPSTQRYADQKAKLLDVIRKWYQGVPRFQYQSNENWASATWTNRYPWAPTGSAGGWRNHYIDDMAWMCLTQIRMYEAVKGSDAATAQTYLAKAKEIYDDYIWTWAWDAEGRGGSKDGLFQYMDSNFSLKSKNACINGPGMIIAAKLSYYSDNASDADKYKEQAILIYEWMRRTLWNSNSGIVSDNWNNERANGGALTYNQGTFIGGCHWLYKLTDNAEYMQSAVKATEYTIAGMQHAGGDGTRLLNSESGATEGNNSVFRAIFLRYFVDMINDPDVEEFSAGARQEWYGELSNWANYVWRDGKGVDKGAGVSNPGQLLFGYDWANKLTDAEIAAGVNLGNMVSGAVLVEAMNIAKDPSAGQ